MGGGWSLLAITPRLCVLPWQIYADICKTFPHQIEHVYIRNVPSKKRGYAPVNETRALLAKRFQHWPEDRWTVFDDATSITADPKAWARRKP